MKKKRLLFVLPAAILALGACTPVEGGGQYGPDQPGPVQPTEKTLVSIAVATQPTKTEYLPGEAFNPAGLTIKATYSDGSTADVDMSKVTYSAMPAATGVVKATFEGKTVDIQVTIKTGVALQSISIEGSLAKTEYEIGESFSTEGLSVLGHYSDDTTASVEAEFEVSPAVAAKGVESISVIATGGGMSSEAKTFAVTVKEGDVPPVTDTITPEQAIALMDEAGESVVVQGLKKVKGICAANTKYDSKYQQYTTGFEGVNNFKLQFKDPENILNGESPDGMEIVVEGYLEMYQGKYQLSYLPADSSPTGEKFTPSLVSATAVEHEGVLVSISIEGSLTKSDYIEGQAYSAAGLSVKGHYDDGSEAPVKATITLDKTTASLGDTKVTASASFEGKNASKEFTVNVTPKGEHTGHEGTLDDPFTPEEAAEIARGLEVTTDSKNPIASEGYYVKGVVTELKESFNAEFGNYSVVLNGDFTLWRIKNGAEFAKFNEGDIEIGDEVVAFVYIMNFNGTPESTSNSYVHSVQKAGDTKTLQSIEIIGSLTKTSYVEGQTYSSAGLSVKGHYDDGSEGVIAATITLNKTTAVLGDTEIIASATFKEITAEPKTFTVTVTEKVPVVGGSVYTFKNDKTQAQNVGTWTSEQFMKCVEVDGGEIITGMKNATNAYIGGNGGSGDATWNIWDSLKIGKSSAKGEITLLLDGTASFSKIKVSAIGARDDGTLTINEITQNVTKKATKDDLEPIELEYEITGGITELKLSSKDATSNNYGIVITRIEFVGGDTPTPIKELSSISIEGALTKTEYSVGETYSTEGLSVKGHYDDGTEGVVPASITLNKTTAALGDTEIIASAEYNGKTAEPKTFTISVAEGQVKNYGTEQAPLTVSQALALITEECTEDKAMTAQEITVEGQITEIKNTFTYESGPCFEFNISDGTSTVYIYRCHCTEQQKTNVVVGATVKLVGYAKNFKGTLEFVDNGASQCHVLAVESDVPDKELSSISIEGALTKTTYTEGEAYSAEGLSVKGHYSDGSSADVSATITLDKTTAAVGDTQIVASAEFNGKTATKDLAVTVNAKKIVTGITFSEEHRTFDQYAEFVKETVTATFTVGDPEIVEATFSTPDMTTAGEKTITVSYTDAYGTTVNNSYTITVVGAPEPELTGITIEGELAKTAYTVGETYSTAGLSVVAHYDNGANTTIDVTISLNKDVAALGDTSITASATYEGKNASKDFTVTTSEEQAQKGTLENPYTVAEVLEAYKDLPVYSSDDKDSCFSNERVYVQGLITGDAPSTPSYTLEGGLIVYKPAAPTTFERPCKGDVAIFEGYVEHYTSSYELASNANHDGVPTCVSIVSRGTSTITLDDNSSANATVTFEKSVTNAADYSFTVAAQEGYQVSCVKIFDTIRKDGAVLEGAEGVYSTKIYGNAKILVETVEEGQKVPTTISTTTSDLVTANGWNVSSGNDMNGIYNSFNLDDNITVSTSGEPNCGSVWGTSPNNDWRVYQNKGGDVTITAAEGYKIVSVKLTFTVSNTGALFDGTTQVISGSDYAVDASSITFTVGNTKSGTTNGQVRITGWSVVYIAL